MTSNCYDDHGQPLVNYRAADRAGRTVDELLGICKGLIADGKLCEAETDFLVAWLNQNAYQAAESSVISLLLNKINFMLADGVIDADERAELFQVLKELTGGPLQIANRVAAFSSTLPLCNPVPPVSFKDQTFCLTGQFGFGTRRMCEEQIIQRGGDVLPGITRQLDFLVIGEIGSRDWKHSSFGNKISKAVEYRERFGLPRIIGEQYWAERL